ncbi:MAG TPA: hypothetical protein VGI98_07000 [Candidatus Limnocylindrales bacterium]
MNPIVWIAIIVVAVIIVGALAWLAGQRRRSSRLREQFGSEYDRTVEASGDRVNAERDLEARQDRVRALEIRPLDDRERDRFRERWLIVQALFVDDPKNALGDADTLIGDVMRARGYPVGDFEQRAADVSVDHPEVVDHYRTAHAIATTQRTGPADTEQLRQAMVHFRALVSDLLDLPSDAITARPQDAASESTAPAAPENTQPAAPENTQPAALENTQPAAATSGAPREP